MLTLNLLMQRSENAGHLQKDHVLQRSTISLKGSVLYYDYKFVCGVSVGVCMRVLFFPSKGDCCIHVQRRRDRINEKMKALQELIPRCNKVVIHI